MTQRAKYIGACDTPGAGTLGTAVKAGGFNDPESVEQGAWLFAPDDEPDQAAYYVSTDDLEFIA